MELAAQYKPKRVEDLNVLIIDDNILVHDIIKKTLNELGLQNIKSAENAFYGLRLCAEIQFDVVLCAFNVKSDRDGFHILEEMKVKGYVNKSTLLIFLSSETDETLVNSISELQPDDFWVKPLNVQQITSRFSHALNTKRSLSNVYRSIDNRDFGQAIYYIDRHLLNPELKKYQNHLLRMKGECYLKLREFSVAETYYRELFEQFNFSWVHLGYVHALLKQDKISEIEKQLETMAQKVETRFATFDLLAEYYVDKEDYQKAYEEIQKAAALSPRNIARNKKVWDLARLNHDQKAQYLATVNMAKYAKNSIHDSPDLMFNVIRSGIDLAQSVDSVESYKLLNRIEAYIQELENSAIGSDFKEQLVVVRARLLNAQEESALATRLVDSQVSIKPTTSLEDNLDKVKVFHELGKREEALILLDAIKKQIASETLSGAVTAKFVEQESKERSEIHFTPKQLNSMAVEFFKKKKMAPALKSLEQALQLTPKNVKVALSLLKVLVAIHRSDGLDDGHKSLAHNTIDVLDKSQLDEKQSKHFNEIRDELIGVVGDTTTQATESVEIPAVVKSETLVTMVDEFAQSS